MPTTAPALTFIFRDDAEGTRRPVVVTDAQAWEPPVTFASSPTFARRHLDQWREPIRSEDSTWQAMA